MINSAPQYILNGKSWSKLIYYGVLFVLCIIIPQLPLYAWTTNGIPICNATKDQMNPKLICDGLGGAIITWQDARNGSNKGIYTQRVNSAGSTLWTDNGVAVCIAGNVQANPALINDGAGGTIITWEDSRNGPKRNLYAQKINSTGSTLWTLNGVQIFTNNSNAAYSPMLVSDDSGGAIITWWDNRYGTNFNIYAQRINSQGSTLWVDNGITICSSANDRYSPIIVTDSTGGAIITWFDYRNGVNNKIFAQRVNSNGSILWNPSGVAICTAMNSQTVPLLVEDDAGGAIITWQDFRNSDFDIYAQRINSQGSTLWTVNGFSVCTSVYDQDAPVIIKDGSGGAIISWYDFRLGLDTDIYAQRMNSDGSTLWTSNGVAICTAIDYQLAPTIASNGSGGAIITWEDNRNGVNYDIYAQEVNSSGSTLWMNNGISICTASDYQYLPQITCDSLSTAIITWYDMRNGSNYDIYAQSISFDGTVDIKDWFDYDSVKSNAKWQHSH